MTWGLWGLDNARLASEYQVFKPSSDPSYFDGMDEDYEGDNPDDPVHDDLMTSWLLGNGLDKRKPHIQRGAEQGPSQPHENLNPTERWLRNMGHEFANRIHHAEPFGDVLFRGMTVSPDWVHNAAKNKSITLPLSSTDEDSETAGNYTSPRVTRRAGTGVFMQIAPGAKAYHLVDSEHVTHGDFDVHDMHRATPEEQAVHGLSPMTMFMHVQQRGVPAPARPHAAARTAMPAIDAYDDDGDEDNVPRGERADHQDVEPGPYFHATYNEFPPGHVLLPRRDLGLDANSGAPNHSDWLWMSKHPADAHYHVGYYEDANVYEVEPLDEGPWKWNKHPNWDDIEDGGNRYVSPRARIIRKIEPDENGEYYNWKPDRTAARTAMPTYYHVTPEHNRDSILQHGLDHTKGEHIHGDTPGNYFWDSPNYAEQYAEERDQHERMEYGDDAYTYTIMPFDHDGPFEIDPENEHNDELGGRSFYTTDPIPPGAFHTVAARTAMPHGCEVCGEEAEGTFEGTPVCGDCLRDAHDLPPVPTQPRKLYRGLYTDPDDVEQLLSKGLGRFWTDDPKYAEQFARGNGKDFAREAVGYGTTHEEFSRHRPLVVETDWDGTGHTTDLVDRFRMDADEYRLDHDTPLTVTRIRQLPEQPGEQERDLLHQPRTHHASRTAMPWYHNTDAELNPGDELLPASQRGHESEWGSQSTNAETGQSTPLYPHYDPHSVYLYNEHGEPSDYEDFGQHRYEVEPIGQTRPDPEHESMRQQALEELAEVHGVSLDEAKGLLHEDDIGGMHSYVAPRARIVRKVEPDEDGNYDNWQPSHTAARTAMPAIDAYDSDQVWRNPAPAVPHGPWYHGSPHQLPEGTVLTPGGGPAQWPDYYRGGGGTRAKRPDWLWLSPDPHQASTWGRYVYEVHPHGDGPWPWNGPDAQQHDGINRPDGYVVPKAHVVRMVHPDEYDVPSENELNAEQDFDGDFDDMLADYQHNYYTRKARTMTAAITVYTKPDCPQCTMTKKQLDKLGVEHRVIDVTADPDAHAYVTGLGYQSAPVVVVGDGERHWGGFSPDKLKGLVGGE